MSKHEIKKDHLLDAGLEVMKNQGFHGTSVKDIVDAAGVPKGSFYNYFPSKEEFSIEALTKASIEAKEHSQKLLGNKQLPPLERLERYFSSQVNDCCADGFSVGCFMGNMCQEMADSNENIRSTLRTALAEHTSLIEQIIKEGIDTGCIDASVDPKSTAEFLFNAWQGAMMRMKAAKCREPLDAFMAQLPRLL
ncbi:TetR/AcrR family transcriptional regulator [Aurantivibrio plasticivorans]